jgi:hypothetical protein
MSGYDILSQVRPDYIMLRRVSSGLVRLFHVGHVSRG